jgi:hypothetical protein
MSNPWNRAPAGAPLIWPYGANGANGDNFSSLPNGQAKCVGVVQPGTLSAPFGDLIIPPWKITFASAPTAGATLSRYLLFSEDNTTPVWPGGISPTSGSDQSALLTALLAYDPQFGALALLDQLTLSSSVTSYYTRWHGLRGIFADGNIPTFTTILCYNQSGVALAAYSSGNQVTTYVTETYN